jgi:hypothetical protein
MSLIPAMSMTIPFLLERGGLFVNLAEWGREAFEDPSRDLFPHIITYPEWFLVQQLSCMRSASGNTRPHREVPLAEKEKIRNILYRRYTFVVVSVNVHIDAAQRVSHERPNHVICIFLYRATVDDNWNMLVCDPNGPPGNSVYGRSLKEFALEAGHDLIYSDREPRHTALSCTHVNECTGEGLCFTGLCVNLMAAIAFAKTKAHNGTEAALNIHDASKMGKDKIWDLLRLLLKGASLSQLRKSLAAPGAAVLPPGYLQIARR